MKMNFIFPAFLVLHLAAVGAAQGDRSAIRRPSFSRVNSRPVVIRLPARRPRIRPLPALSSSGTGEQPTDAATAAASRPTRPRIRPPLPVKPKIRPAPRPPPPPPAQPSQPVAPPPQVPSLSPAQLNKLLGLAGLNGNGNQKTPNLASLAGLASGRPGISTASGLPNLNVPTGILGGSAPVASPKLSLPPPVAAGPLPGTFGSGGPVPPLPPLPSNVPTGVNSPLPATVNAGSQGLLGVLQTLAKQFTQSTGLAKLIPGQQAGGASGTGASNEIPLIPGLSQLFSSGSGGGGGGGPPVAGIPRIPGINLPDLTGGAIQNSDGQIDVVNLIYGGLTRNGKTATFTALKIYREGSEFGQVRYSIGYAFRGGHRKAMLQMHSSETTEPAPYWIYRVGPEGEDPFGNTQYEYAVVSNWVKYPVTVLVRDPDKFKQEYEVEVLRWLEDNGFINAFVRAFNLLQPVSYDNCQYADSTFEVFG